jgi:2-polyprenyl-3-methyl-5-hydroxy-6-metoxy-1,4-benzoquinol methylase
MPDSAVAPRERSTKIGSMDHAFGKYPPEQHNDTPSYLWPRAIPILSGLKSGASILDAGCGNGLFAKELCDRGFRVCGIDAEASGIELARKNAPSASFTMGSIYDDLRGLGGAPFDAIVSLEVIEHLHRPRLFVDRAFECIKPGGLFVLSTPYHGYLKNLVLAAAGKMDWHYTALWEGGHVKFWSRNTLTELGERAGFRPVGFAGAGRMPWMWKSMVLTFNKP